MKHGNTSGSRTSGANQTDMDPFLLEGYISAWESHQYREENTIRKQQMGNWIISLQRYGYGAAIYIYNAVTLQENYKVETIGLNCCDTAPEDIKAFYRRILDRDFSRVVSLAESWNNAAGHLA